MWGPISTRMASTSRKSITAPNTPRSGAFNSRSGRERPPLGRRIHPSPGAELTRSSAPGRSGRPTPAEKFEAVEDQGDHAEGAADPAEKRPAADGIGPARQRRAQGAAGEEDRHEDAVEPRAGGGVDAVDLALAQHHV